MSRRVVNILFDLDGTLTDPREGIIACFKHALLGLGYCTPSDSDLERYIGPPLQDCFASLLGSEGQKQIDSAVALYRQRFSTEGMFENHVYPGVRAALTRLEGLGAALYVATSKPHVFAEPIVTHLGLKSHFRAVYGCELDGARSNKAELIAHVLREESLPASATVMIGDRDHDIIGAKANGVFPIGVLWGYGTREELSAAGATVFCEQPEMLSGILSSRTALR
jgi:phosphoglycolate phosphatase